MNDQQARTKLFESFKHMGMTEAEAKVAAAGRNGKPIAEVTEQPVDATTAKLTEAFRHMGMSEAEAKTAACGRYGPPAASPAKPTPRREMVQTNRGLTSIREMIAAYQANGSTLVELEETGGVAGGCITHVNGKLVAR